MSRRLHGITMNQLAGNLLISGWKRT